MDRAIERLAARQHGVVSRQQVLSAGLTQRAIHSRLASGRWENVNRGVYRVVPIPPSWHQRLMAAVLHAGPSALASHRAAAALWSLDGVTANHLELSVPSGRQIRGVLVHRLRPEDQPQLVVIDGIPATGIERTLLDLAAVLASEPVGHALDGALRDRRTTITALWGSLPPSARAGRGVLRKLLEERSEDEAATESHLETLLLRLLRSRGLPSPELQYPVIESGACIARLDFAYPDHRLGIEADGYRWHSGAQRWREDMWRENRLKLLGWTLLRFSWRDVRDRPRMVANQVGAALAHFGQGSLH